MYRDGAYVLRFEVDINDDIGQQMRLIAWKESAAKLVTGEW